MCEKAPFKRSISALEEIEDNPIEPLHKRPRLTQKNLQICEMQSSNANTNTPFQPLPSRPPTLSTAKTTKTKSVSASDSAFGDAALANHIYDHTTSLQPANIGYWNEVCSRSRDTASPDESQYQDYVYHIHAANSEATIIQHNQKLLKEYKGASEHGYRKTYNETLSEVPANIGFNNGLSNAQPDLLEGYDLAMYRPFPARKELQGTAVLKRGARATTLPHFAGEWKGPGKDLRQAASQAAYDGAIMVRGRTDALSYLHRSDPDNYANVATFTSDGTILDVYTHHSTFDGETTEYHQSQIKEVSLTASYDEYKKGRRILRNVQDATRDFASALKHDLVSNWNLRKDGNRGAAIVEGVNNAAEYAPTLRKELLGDGFGRCML